MVENRYGIVQRRSYTRDVGKLEIIRGGGGTLNPHGVNERFSFN